MEDTLPPRPSPYADAIWRVERYHKDLEEFWKKADNRLGMAIDALLGLQSRMDKVEGRLEELERPQPITAEDLAQRIAALEERLEDEARRPVGLREVAPDLAAALDDLGSLPLLVERTASGEKAIVPLPQLTRVFNAMNAVGLL